MWQQCDLWHMTQLNIYCWSVKLIPRVRNHDMYTIDNNLKIYLGTLLRNFNIIFHLLEFESHNTTDLAGDMECDILHNVSGHLLAPSFSSMTSDTIRPHDKVIKNIWHGSRHSIKVKVPANPANNDEDNQSSQPENKIDYLNQCFQNVCNHFWSDIWNNKRLDITLILQVSFHL